MNTEVVGYGYHFLKHDLRSMKEAHKLYERLREKYDIAVARYSGLSKTKDSAALQEVRFLSVSHF